MGVYGKWFGRLTMEEVDRSNELMFEKKLRRMMPNRIKWKDFYREDA